MFIFLVINGILDILLCMISAFDIVFIMNG